MDKKNSKKKFKLPTSFTTLLIITVIVAILTFIIPAGQYEYENGVPISGTYQTVEKSPQGLWDIFSAPIKGFESAILIAIFIIVIGGFLGVIFETRAIDAGLSNVIKKLKGKEELMIPIVIFLCALGGTSYGMSEETIAFYPIIIPILLKSGYDVVTGMMTIFLGAGMGVSASILNPFAVGISSGLASTSIGDGIVHRVVLFTLYYIFAVTFVLKYARKVKKDPTKSIVYDIKDTVEKPFQKISDEELSLNKKRKIVLTIFSLSFLIMILGIIPWKAKFGIDFFDNIHSTISKVPILGDILGGIPPLGDWYFTEMSVLFLISSILIGIVYGYKEGKIVSLFISGAKDLLGVALILGVAKGISVIMTDGMIIDTILHAGENFLKNISSTIFPMLTYLLYIPMAFLIPSTSGLATATIPILAPLADFANVGREFVVTALSAGGETMNYFSPTQVVLVGALAFTNIPYERWIKHISPYVLGVIFITCATLTITYLI